MAGSGGGQSQCRSQAGQRQSEHSGDVKLFRSSKRAAFLNWGIGRRRDEARRDSLRRRHLARRLAVEPLEQRRLLTQVLWDPEEGIQAEGESLPTEVAFRLEVTDLAGKPITQTIPGSDFFLLVWVRDQREFASPAGVYAAYLDVTYDDDLLAVLASDNARGFDIEYGTAFENGHKGSADTPGLIDEVGAFQTGFAPLGPGEHLLFWVRFTAGDVALVDDYFEGILEDSAVVELDVLDNDYLQVGNATFGANPADIRPAHDVLVFSPPRIVPDGAMQFLGTQLEISDAGQAVITDVGVPTAGGTVLVANDGISLLYRPAPDFHGTESFTYTVAGAATATATVVVEGVNDAPEAMDDIYSTGQQETLTVERPAWGVEQRSGCGRRSIDREPGATAGVRESGVAGRW